MDVEGSPQTEGRVWRGGAHHAACRCGRADRGRAEAGAAEAGQHEYVRACGRELSLPGDEDVLAAEHVRQSAEGR